MNESCKAVKVPKKKAETFRGDIKRKAFPGWGDGSGANVLSALGRGQVSGFLRNHINVTAQKAEMGPGVS